MNTEYTYIVTGCTGFVGNVLTKKLLEEGCSVVGLARSEQKAVRVFGENAPKMVYGDITDPKAAEELFCGNKPFVVIHTVAKVSIGESSAQELYDVTVNGTKNVVKASLQHDVKKFIHISSTEALPRGMKQGERYIPDPKKSRKGYARTKSEADAVVLRAVAENGLNASILLFASVLGPGDYGNGHMSQMFSDFLGGRLPASVRAGYNDFDIRDVADVLPAIIERSEKGESYIFANKPDRIDEILGYVSEFSGRKNVPALPLWMAYLGLPFLYVLSKIRKTRPLYTASALAAIREKADFSIQKAVDSFGYSPRPLRDTVIDHVKFLVEIGKIKL